MERKNQFVLLGSSDEAFGNQSGQYLYDNTMVIKVASKFASKYGEFIRIPNIQYKYGQEHIDRARETYKGVTKSGQTKLYRKSPMTHRFFRNDYGWYIATTVNIEEKPNEGMSDVRIGALGVDFNVNFAIGTLTDRFGNPIKEFKIDYKMYGAKTGQIDASVGDLAKQICNIGVKYNVPIILEDLCFANAKQNTDKGPKYNRMINTFPYAKFRDSIIARGSKVGCKVIVVNPAYTSIIGQFKFMKRYGLSSHGSAACAIARRGQGYDMPRIESFRKMALSKKYPKLNLNQKNEIIWKRLSQLVKKNFTFNDRIKMLYEGCI